MDFSCHNKIPQMINMFFVGLLSSKNQLLKNKSLGELDIQVRS